MLKCKHCQGTEFGVTVIETKMTGYKAINGEVVEQIGKPETKSENKISYCFGCNKPITDKDTYESETCSVCGKEVEELVDGKCNDCNAQVKKLANMTKEELILMMLQGKVPQVGTDNKQDKKSTKETKKKDNKKTETKKNVEKEQPKADSMVDDNKKEKVDEATVSDKVEISEKESNANLKVDDVDLGESELNFAEEKGDVSFPDVISDEDILSQIDKVANLDSLNIMSEDIVQPI